MDSGQSTKGGKNKKKFQGGGPGPSGQPARPAGQGQPQQQKAAKQGQGGGGGKYKQKQLQKQQQLVQQQQQLQVQEEGTQILLPSTGTAAPLEETLASVKLDEGTTSASTRQVLLRPKAHGIAGQAVRLEVNYLAVGLDKLPPKAYHYDVDIQKPASRKWQRACFTRFCAEKLPNVLVAFDGNKNAYTVHPLDEGRFGHGVEVVVTLDNRERRFTLSVKLANVVDLRCLKSGTEQNLAKLATAKQCLEVAFGSVSDRNAKFIKFKRSCYLAPLKRIDVGVNHELWYGLHQSLILGSKLFLNVDVAHKAFPSGVPVLNVVGDLARRRWNDPPNVPEWADEMLASKLDHFLKGLEVSYTGPSAVKKVFKYNGLKGPASKQTFKSNDGTQMTVAAYFEQQGYRLRYPNLPVMHVGSTVRNIMLPMELCQILPGQALNKKHPDECTANIIKLAATDTDTRKRKITELKDQLNYNGSPILKEFGIGVGKDFEEIDGRIIAPPQILYKNAKTVRPDRGQWDAEGTVFVTTKQPELRWIIFNLDGYAGQQDINTFGRNIFNESRKKGMQLQSFSMQNTYYEPRNMRMNAKQLNDELLKTFNDFKKQQMDIVVVVIPSFGDHYFKTKQNTELVIGLLTTCIKGNTIKKSRSPLQVVNNILLKMNGKTNGTNHVVRSPNPKIPLIKKRVMYIGADVTHPSPEQTMIPSIAGVAASFDLEGFRYRMNFRLQHPKEEMIQDLETIVKYMLSYYKAQNNQLPETILYYRDGVSDGQFSQVLDIELNAIQRAAATTNAKITVTFIVVQKRHHTRFFPGPRCPKDGKNQNVPPGTVVDKYITSPNHFQFFLTSHQAIQGVAKPAKYTVLYDDERYDPDQLESLTYALCHMYARCNRAVSYPAPTYYAHWIAARGKVYIQGRQLNMENLEQENKQLQVKAEIVDRNPMFFI